MLGWEEDSTVSEIESCTLDLIDHIVSGNIGAHRAPQEPPSQATRLTWDGRKGQWIPLSYSFSFPSGPFDHIVRREDQDVQCRPLAAFSFPPSKRHAVMLDQGSPKLRLVPRSTLKGRHVRNVPDHDSSLLRSPLTSCLRNFPLLGEEESEEECNGASAWETYDPFNLPARPVQPITWLDDVNIEDFLSSAIDYQADGGGTLHSEPTKAGKRWSPCTPSSPPPPLFSFPDIKISPPRFTATPR